MKHHCVLTLVCACGIATIITVRAERAVIQTTPASSVFDWPQWQGPDRTGVSKETGLLQEWPAAGPPIVWSISGLGAGYGSLAIRNDRIYVQALSASGSVV